jgi:alkylation response protein AidB-like acyl-CoA dehydrogenase
VGERLRSWGETDAAALPLPGGGATWSRFVALAALAEEDLALGRLGEGHADARAILAEAGRRAGDGDLYGVWAARSAGADVDAVAGRHAWCLKGRKEFCSGAGLLDRALVTVNGPDGVYLLDVELRRNGVEVVEGTWPAVGMAASDSRTVSFTGVEVAAEAVVGGPGFYTSRIGFWFGAVGVAACWWGGGRGLMAPVGRSLRGATGKDGEVGVYGSARARLHAAEAALRWAASEIDARPPAALARRLALLTREVVHASCRSVLDDAAAAGGARSVCLDAAQSRRSADLYAYLAQHHGVRDAAALGRDLLGPDPD